MARGRAALAFGRQIPSFPCAQGATIQIRLPTADVLSSRPLSNAVRSAVRDMLEIANNARLCGGQSTRAVPRICEATSMPGLTQGVQQARPAPCANGVAAHLSRHAPRADPRPAARARRKQGDAEGGTAGVQEGAGVPALRRGRGARKEGRRHLQDRPRPVREKRAPLAWRACAPPPRRAMLIVRPECARAAAVARRTPQLVELRAVMLQRLQFAEPQRRSGALSPRSIVDVVALRACLCFLAMLPIVEWCSWPCWRSLRRVLGSVAGRRVAPASPAGHRAARLPLYPLCGDAVDEVWIQELETFYCCLR